MKYLVKIAKIIKFAFKGSKKNNHSIGSLKLIINNDGNVRGYFVSEVINYLFSSERLGCCIHPEFILARLRHHRRNSSY